MSHPDLNVLTAWIHEFLEPGESGAVSAHVSECAECRATLERLRGEAEAIAAEIAPDGRLAALKDRLLRQAATDTPRVAARRGRGLLWQVPLAAVVLVGLVAVLVSPGPRHQLVAGRVALEDGHEVAAPTEFTGLRSWRLQAVEKSSVRLSDRSTIEIGRAHV